MGEVLTVQNLGKQYRRYHSHRPVTFKESFIRGFHWLRPVDQFWALRHVSFSLGEGRTLGVVGRNGSGKTTLLQLIGKVLFVR